MILEISTALGELHRFIPAKKLALLSFLPLGKAVEGPVAAAAAWTPAVVKPVVRPASTSVKAMQVVLAAAVESATEAVVQERGGPNSVLV